MDSTQQDTASITRQIWDAGVAYIPGILPADAIDEMQAFYEKSIKRRLIAGTYPYRIAGLGLGRQHIALGFHGPLQNEAIYAPLPVMLACRQLLGPDFVWPAAGIALAEPDCSEQYIHRDHLMPWRKPEWNAAVPPVVLTLGIPLIDFDEQTGSTEFQIGSHRPTQPAHMEQRRPIPNVDFTCVYPKRGDLVVWDGRIIHRGTRNVSDTERPLLLIYFQASWFLNISNFDPEVYLAFFESDIGAVPAGLRHLFGGLHRYLPRAGQRTSRVDECVCGSGLRFKQCHGRFMA